MSVARQYTTTSGPTAATAPVATGTRPAGWVSSEPGVPAGARFPVSVFLLGIVTVLVAGWGAAAPYAAPDFGFTADRATAWQWTTTSAVLALAPGAVAFVCGLLVLSASSRVRYGRRPDLWLLGFLVALCGAWFVVGQYAWPVLDGRIFIGPSGRYHFLMKELCFAVGPGVLLVLCGSVFMGWAIRRHVTLAAERYPRAVPPAAVPYREGAVAERPVVGGTTATGGTGTMAPPPAERVVGAPAERVVGGPAEPVTERVATRGTTPAGQHVANRVETPPATTV